MSSKKELNRIKKFLSENQLREFEIDGTKYFVNDELFKIGRLFNSKELKDFQSLKTEYSVEIQEDEEILLIATNGGDVYALNKDNNMFLNMQGSKNIKRDDYMIEKRSELLEKIPSGAILKIISDCENVFSGNSKKIEFLKNSSSLYNKKTYR